MIRNYFADLELTPEASIEEIRQAYRKLVRRYHPDLNPEDPSAVDSFHIIHEAFEYLSSELRLEKLRRQLDVDVSVIRKLKKSTQLPALRKTDSPRISNISRISKTKQKIVRVGDDLDIHLTAFVDGPIRGGTHIIEYHYMKPCGTCQGGRAKEKLHRESCKSCAGVGFSLIHRGANRWKKSCEVCMGRGYVTSHCPDCQGRARLPDKQIVEFKVPTGADLKQPICLRRLGHISFDGLKRGDVWVLVEATR